MRAEKKQDSEKEALLESYQSSVLDSAEKEIFFLAGALDELKIVISSGPTVRNYTSSVLLELSLNILTCS